MKKKISIILCTALCLTMMLPISAGATGDPAVTIPTVQSSGTMIINVDGIPEHTVKFYSSDIVAVNECLRELAIYSKDNIDRLDSKLTTLQNVCR